MAVEAHTSLPDPEPSLESWLGELHEPRELTCTWAFPSPAVRAEYLDSIGERSDGEVRDLLRRFLIPSGSLRHDRWAIVGLRHLIEERPDQARAVLEREWYRRLLNRDGTGEPTWQGITWVLDLVPGWPLRAIEVIDAYVAAHAQDLPDGRLVGLGDAQAIIRAMWIGNPVSSDEKRELVFQLGPRKFEHLIDSLYKAMGFETTLTPEQRDGGRDVVAVSTTPGDKQRNLIECKLSRKTVGVDVVRALLGVVSHERSTKGVVVAAGRFSSAAWRLADENARIELLGWDQLLPLLDQHFGADWARTVDWRIAQSVKRAGLREPTAEVIR